MAIMHDEFLYIKAFSKEENTFLWVLSWTYRFSFGTCRKKSLKSMPLVPEFHLSMSDLWNVTARVAVLFPANLWCNSRERSPFVALDFKDFVHGVASVYVPWDLPHLLELGPKLALKPTATFYNPRMIPGLRNRVAELARVSAGRLDDRPSKLSGKKGVLALTTA